MFLEEIPAGALLFVVPIWGIQDEGGSSATSTEGNVANCTTAPKAPAPVPGVRHDASLLFHFPPASHRATFISSEGWGSAVLPGTQKIKASIWWKALMPAMDRFTEKKEKENKEAEEK